MEIFELKYGWSKKYIWFGVVQNVYEGMDFNEHIKNKTISFNIDTGTLDADCLGSGTGHSFYSEAVINAMRENGNCLFSDYQIITSPTFTSKYFLLEIKSVIPRIKCSDTFSEPDIDKYCLDNGVTRNMILKLGNNINPLYADMNKWDGSELFTLENSYLHLITRKLKEHLERNSFINLIFEKIEFVK